MVALSGGKDSLVTLDLCRRHFAHVECFYMFHVQGLACIERNVDAAARRAGVRVHKVPHPDLARIMRQSMLRPFTREANDIKRIKQSDVEAALTERTGIRWFAYGERAADSFARRLYTRKNDGVREDWRRFYPVWDWLHGEVMTYLKVHRIPLPERLGASDTKVMSGFGLYPRPLHWMKHNVPEDYAKVLVQFPYAEAMVMRYELEQAKKQRQPAVVKPERKRKPKPRAARLGGLKRSAAEPVSEVRAQASAPLAAAGGAVQPAED
jgi:phosphoadenosine phosphosulfate reductase